jgi:hypothetical protein
MATENVEYTEPTFFGAFGVFGGHSSCREGAELTVPSQGVWGVASPRWIFAALLLAVPAAAQDAAPAPAAAAAARAPAGSVGGIDAPDTGAIAGVVAFQGEKPERKPLAEIAGNAFCQSCYAGKPLPLADRWVFGKNGDADTLEGVLVYVSGGLEGRTFAPPPSPAMLDQAGCVYVPHVVGVMAGQTLEIRNSDATLHNVMTTPQKNDGFNVGMSTQGSRIERVFKLPEFKIRLECFMHKWMSAIVHVLPHPYFAVTGGDGTWTLKGLPPGEYEVSVLHEAAALAAEPKTQRVTVAAGETRQVGFTYRWKSAPAR